jgi:hypothetical protein
MGATPVPVTEIDRTAREMEADVWHGPAVGEGCAATAAAADQPAADA